jgi:hypothetical protein
VIEIRTAKRQVGETRDEEEEVWGQLAMADMSQCFISKGRCAVGGGYGLLWTLDAYRYTCT